MPEDSKMTLWQKLIEIRKTCAYLKKDNQGFQFKFVSSSQTLGTLRGKMDELGVLLIPSVKNHTVSDHTTATGKHEYFTETELEYIWVNADNPDETITCSWYAQGLDDGEKGVGKAVTYGEKYFLLKFFNIATNKDDPDAHQKKYDTDASPAENGTPPPQNAPNQQNPVTPPPRTTNGSQGGSRSCTPKQAAALFNILQKPEPKALTGILRHITKRTDITSTYQLTSDESRVIFDISKEKKDDLDELVKRFKAWAADSPEPSQNIDAGPGLPPDEMLDKSDDGCPF